MTNNIGIENWETFSKKVYWDRDVLLDKWRKKISEGHRSYLPDAVSVMTPVEFIWFYGAQRFRLDWPMLRAFLAPDTQKRVSMYDIAWSRLIGGGWNLIPTDDFLRMPTKRRQFLVYVAGHPGDNIYEIAKSLGMQYRRAHEHAMNLINDGKIRAVTVVDGGRRKSKLFPAYQSN